MTPFVLLVLGPLIAAAAVRATAGPWRLLSPAVPAAMFAYLVALAPGVIDGESLEAGVPWLTPLGIEIAFRLDAWSLLFALLITGIGTLVLVYSREYMAEDSRRLEPPLLLFMAAMLGAVLADDLVTLYVAWELTGVVSFLLIGFEHERASARTAAQQALIVTAGGGLVMLAGFILLAVEADSWRISTLAGRIDPASPLMAVATVCVVIGAATKSAQFPLHGWLPGAMAAPTPVSAYLHSATMVKLGVYLLGRMHPALGETAVWTALVPALGAATMVVGAVLAVREDDLKRVLAYSTVSALGSMVLLAGLGTSTATKALVLVLVGHAGYKAALFLAAGAIEHGSGSRSWRRLGALRRAMPLTFAATALGAASLAGLPPTAGFLAKETLIEAGQLSAVATLLLPAIIVASVLQVVVAGLIAVAPFAGDPARASAAVEHPHDGGPALWGPPALLGVLGLTGGFAMVLAPGAVEAAAGAVYGRPVEVELHLWPGFGTIIALSALTLAAGALGYRWRERLGRLPWPVPSAERVFSASLDGLIAGGEWLSGRIQTGSLHQYLTVTLLTAALPILLLVWRYVPEPSLSLDEASPGAIAVPPLIIVAAIVAATSPSRLRAIVALGASGFGIALLFASYGAPDLAMTQVLIETLTVVLLLSAFRFLPVAPQRATRAVRAGDAAVAVGVGCAMTLLAWTVMRSPSTRHVSQFFANASVPEAEGRNVVNTILVDFRALDTIAEITVLAVAAIGVLALLGGVQATQRRRRRTPSLVLRTATSFLMSLLLVFAVFLLLRGHNEPGGGFVAGLVGTAAIVLYAMAYGFGPARRLIRVQPTRLIAGGLAIALASALPGVLLGDGALVGQWVSLTIGDEVVKLGTPLLFDLGVFGVVLGVATAMVTTLSEAA